MKTIIVLEITDDQIAQLNELGELKRISTSGLVQKIANAGFDICLRWMLKTARKEAGKSVPQPIDWGAVR